MVILWQEQAKLDLKNYAHNSKIYTEGKLTNYISSLVDYVDTLYSSPLLGKIFCTLNGVELRQLIFKMHRIFYYIKNDTIYILAVVHSSRNIDNVIKIMNDYLK